MHDFILDDNISFQVSGNEDNISHEVFVKDVNIRYQDFIQDDNIIFQVSGKDDNVSYVVFLKDV